MKPKLKTIICVLLFVPVYLLLYTVLHEGGHALVILAYGGIIDNFDVLGLNAHVRFHGAVFSALGAALNHAAGVLLPIIIGAIAIILYKPKVKFAGYHICYFMGSVSLVGSMLVWVAFPAISLFTPPPQAEDATKFLNATGFHPLLVSLGALLLAGTFIFFLYKKGLLGKAKEAFIFLRGSDYKSNHKGRLMIAALILLVGAVSVFFAVNNWTLAPVVFSTSFHTENALNEKNWECTFSIEETKSYSVDLEMQARGFITAVRITDESGELAYQNLGEEFSFTMSMELDAGEYKLSLTHLKDMDDVEQFMSDTGQQGTMSPNDIQYMTEVFSHNANEYSTSFSMKIR